MKNFDQRLVRDLLDTIDIAVEIRDARGRTVYINPAFTRVMGHPPQAIVDQDGAEVLGEAWTLPTPGQAVMSAAHCNRYQGGGIACEASASTLVGEHGKLDGYIIMRRPMGQGTSRKGDRRARTAADPEMDIAHELRTPLNVIIGYSELLIEDAEKAGRDQELTDLRRIHQAGKQLQKLIQTLMRD